MASFDIESIFTNIPLQETIDLCVQKLFEDKNYIDGLSKDSFCEMLTVTIPEYFISSFSKKKIIWLEKCPSEFRPIISKRHDHDTFLLYQNIDQI